MDWNRLTCVDPGTDAVDLATAKQQLRVEFDDHDDLIGSLIASAQAMIHGPDGIGVALCASQWRLSLDAFPCGWIKLPPLGVVSAIASLTYTDLNGQAQTLTGGTDYVSDFDQTPAIIALPPGNTWPATLAVPGAVKITFTAGPVKPNAKLVQAILLAVTDWYSQPNAEGSKAQFALPNRAKDLLATFGPGSIG